MLLELIVVAAVAVVNVGASGGYAARIVLLLD
jgi:hypothetical protein